MSNVWSPLTTHFAINLQDSDPRRSRIDTIQDHHTATNNKYNALGLFAPGGRTVTPNYFICGKEIWGIVPENRRAYTSASAVDDHRSVTMEILNSTNNPDWQFLADTLDTVARLHADLARRYGIRLAHALPGVVEHRNLYEWYGRSYATACAGPSFHIDKIIAAAKTRPQPVKPPARKRRNTTMFGMRINDGRGRYGKVGAWLYATFDSASKTITYLTEADANQTSVNLGKFANLTYAGWEGYHLQAEHFIDATVDPPVRLSEPKMKAA